MTHRSINLFQVLTLALILGMQVGCSNAQHVKVTLPAQKPDPQLAIQLNNQAMTKMTEEQPLEAIALLQRAISADPQAARYYNNLGKVYFQEDQFADAMSMFTKAIELDQGKNPQPLNNAGMVYERARKFDLALEHYNKAHQLEPDNITYTANIARVLHRNGDRSDKLVKLLDQIILRDTRPDWQQWAMTQKANILSLQKDSE